MKQQPGTCPMCGGNLIYKSSETYGDEQHCKCECLKCGFIGTEHYALTFIRFTDELGELV